MKFKVRMYSEIEIECRGYQTEKEDCQDNPSLCWSARHPCLVKDQFGYYPCILLKEGAPRVLWCLGGPRHSFYLRFRLFAIQENTPNLKDCRLPMANSRFFNSIGDKTQLKMITLSHTILPC
jgi:hypothetical protein